MKFRKRPIVVEAFQLTPDWIKEHSIPNYGVLSPNVGLAIGSLMVYRDHADISTLEGMMRADLWDWIITGVQGEQYPCKPDIFNQTYESA